MAQQDNGIDIGKIAGAVGGAIAAIVAMAVAGTNVAKKKTDGKRANELRDMDYKFRNAGNNLNTNK